jgi:hypothetical protein
MFLVVDTATITITTTISTTTLQASQSSFLGLTTSTTSYPQSKSSTESSTRIESEHRATPNATHMELPERTTTDVSSHSSQKSLPIATIVGATIGGAFLILLTIFLLVCIRYRRKESPYQAPKYGSSYNTSSAMTPDPGTAHEVKFSGSHDGIQQLDSKEVEGSRRKVFVLPQRFAELPAEPVTRR